MLTVSEVTKSYGGKTLFEEVTTSFEPGHRYGLTGANGAGKSTFMKILAGQLEPDKGTVSRLPRSRLSVLHQDHYRYENDRIRDVVIMGNTKLWAAMAEKERLLASGDTSDEVGMRLGELEGTIAEENGYGAEYEAEQLLEGLGLPANQQEQQLKVLTGGMRLRVLLAQALFGAPDILLLDEPTNHLDLESIHWLSNFLMEYRGVLVVISHDRYFLNEVCTHTADVDYQNIITYTGGYDEMMQSRRRAISKIDLVDLKRSNIQRPFIRFDPKTQSGKLALAVDKLSKSFEKPVLVNLIFNATRGEKIAVVGPNGIGKTTLLKCLAGVYEPDRGKIVQGHEVVLGYLPQDHEEGIGKADNMTAFQWLYQWDPKSTVEEIRGLLGRMLFPSEDADKPVKALSGGETVRLLLAKLTLTKPNLLLMDEPTNHLDLESIRALTEALQRYEGTLIFVSHDHAMIAEVATQVLELKGEKGYDLFPGSYEEFLEKTGKNDKR